MVRQFVLGAAAVLSIVASTAKADFLPANNLYLQDNLFKSNPNIAQTEFNAINAKGLQIFTPIIQAFGGTFRVNGNWNDATVNANATQSGRTWTVNMYGGLARRAEVTPDGFTLVLCHEIGHHLGGFPFVSNWAGNEGQADTFSTAKCAHLFWDGDTAGNEAARANIPAAQKAQCDSVYSTQAAQDVCYRTILGGKSLGDLLAALGGDTVSFDTPDTSEVDQTNDDHPAAQCRLDTYVAGALCSLSYDQTLIPGKRNGTGRNDAAAEAESATQYCADRANGALGARPLCWFKPGA